MPPPKVAIIGAGPAGLTLGLLLYRRSIPFTIYEYRQKPTEEELAEPCGVLDLHDESGQAALKACGVFDDFLNLTGECSEAQRVSDMHGSILYADEGELSDRPEISRHALTKLLLDHVPSSAITWNHKLLSATKSSNGTVLDFGTNGKQTFDFVVGGDGAWSRVRALLTDVRPEYAGVHNVTITIRGITERYPDLAEFVGPGSFSALGLNHGVMSQRGPRDSARIYCMLKTPEDFASASKLFSMSPLEAADMLLNDDILLGRWGPKVKKLVSTACKDEANAHPRARIDIKALYTLPSGHSWQHKPGVTLIGDAAHLMCPWAGEGVNLAMWDALDLSGALVQAVKSFQDEDGTRPFAESANSFIKEFEAGMWARATDKAEETERNGRMLFGDDAAKGFVRFFEAAYTSQANGGDGAQ